jgi:ATP-dependent DNA helicase RecG
VGSIIVSNMNAQEAIELLEAVRRGEFEDAGLEVKRAQRGLPQRLFETLSAFANQAGGGVILLGVDESQGFRLAGVEAVQTVISELTDLAGKMIPPLALEITPAEIENKTAIVVDVPECDYQHKPCHYGPSGMQAGSFLRVGNQNRHMSAYEVFTFVTGRGQPTFDQELVQKASIEDLDQVALEAYFNRLKQSRRGLWQRLRLEEKDLAGRLLALEILGRDGEKLCPTLSGLLAFGTWPQKYYPSLMITFVRYVSTDRSQKGPRGERFMDNAQFEGRLEEMVDEAVGRCLMNMRQSTLIEGILHRNIPEYPEEAVREALINAIAHRDYSPYVLGSHVRIEMFADRLEIMTPGGLFGPVNESNLECTQSTRNQLLMRIMSEIGLAENRGSGIEAMLNAQREAHLEPPLFQDTRTYFTVTFSNQTLLDPETVTWLNRYASLPINPRQRTALAYLHRHKQITNPEYCRLNNVDSLVSTRELRGLVDSSLISMHGTRRWAFYTIQIGQLEIGQPTSLIQSEGLQLNLRQKAGLDFLSQSGVITTEKYIHVNGGTLAARTARADLQGLETIGLIKKVGKGRATYYVLAVPK